MGEFGPQDICFVGLGRTVPNWYRCALPALELGAYWYGASGKSPSDHILTGNTMTPPNLFSFKVVVLQQVYGQEWVDMISALRARGVKVLYEVDDFMHGVASQPQHSSKNHFNPQILRLYEEAMEVCDGIICSTSYIADAYSIYNKTWICENGIDLKRYQVTRPERDTVNIGWEGGGTGHSLAVVPWLERMYEIMRERDNTKLVTLGQRLDDKVFKEFGERAMHVPFTVVECFPGALANLDISLAPYTDTSFYAAKSDLRWLEASALKMPTVGDPRIYHHMVDGETGMYAFSGAQAKKQVEKLLDDPELSKDIGQNAYDYVKENRDISVAVGQWIQVFEEVVE